MRTRKEPMHLQPRQIEVLALVEQGYSIQEAAELMGCTYKAAHRYHQLAISKLARQERAKRSIEIARKIAAEWGITHES